MRGVMRSALGGESLFSQVITAEHADGDAVFGAPEIGDVEVVRLTPTVPLLLQKGAFLAADNGIEISTATQSEKGC